MSNEEIKRRAKNLLERCKRVRYHKQRIRYHQHICLNPLELSAENPDGYSP